MIIIRKGRSAMLNPIEGSRSRFRPDVFGKSVRGGSKRSSARPGSRRADRGLFAAALLLLLAGFALSRVPAGRLAAAHRAVARDVSPALASLAPLPKDVGAIPEGWEQEAAAPAPAAPPSIPPGSVAVEQTEHGTNPPPEILAGFDGIGEGFVGPHGTAVLQNPSDNSLAVGPDHIVQIVNTRMAVFTKKGKRFDTTGRILYGPVNTNNIFRGFGDAATINNGDAVVRYDQLADRWLIVMPIFRRLSPRPDDPKPAQSGDPAHRSVPAVSGQP